MARPVEPLPEFATHEPEPAPESTLRARAARQEPTRPVPLASLC